MANKKWNCIIPQKEIKSLAFYLLPHIQQLFETEQGKKDFENWIEEIKQYIDKQTEISK